MGAGEAAVLEARTAVAGSESPYPEPDPSSDALFAPPQAAANGKVVFSLGQAPAAVPANKQSKWSPVHVWRMRIC